MKKITGKVIYFGDIAYSGDCESLEEEFTKNTLKDLQRNDLEIDVKKIEFRETPPWKEKYDILFFDWGGMSIGNSMLEHFCEYIIEEAEKYPNRIYIMTSFFTAEAIKEAIDDIGEDKPNIFLDIEKFAAYYKQYY